MKHLDMRLAISLMLLTVGVGVMLIGISWLTFFGLALVVVSTSTSANRRARVIAVLLCLAGAVFGLTRGSRAFSRDQVEWWYVVVLTGSWLGAVITLFHQRREDRRLKV